MRKLVKVKEEMKIQESEKMNLQHFTHDVAQLRNWKSSVRMAVVSASGRGPAALIRVLEAEAKGMKLQHSRKSGKKYIYI